MKFSFLYVSALLTKLQAAYAVASLAGVQVPPVVADSIVKLGQVANVTQGFVVPDSAQNIITDVENALKTSEIAIPHEAAQAHIESVLSLIEKVPATFANLENRQPAELLAFEMKFKDGPDMVDVFGLRRSSKSQVAKDLGEA